MKDRTELLQKFAALVVRVGANVQPGQVAIINSDIQSAPMTRLIVEECWKAGASDVLVRYTDEPCTRLRYEYGTVDRLSQVKPWQLEQLLDYSQREVCLISVDSNDPDLLAGIAADKVGSVMNAVQAGMKPFYDLLDKGENQWTVVAVPSPAWAAKVFPELPVDQAVDKLWDAIALTTRLDTPDPVAAWQQHRTALAAYSKFMNESGIRTLHFQNSLGTDLTLDLAEGNRWAGGGDQRDDGVPYHPNMPTEEVFSMPHRAGVNGKVVASLPLCYRGSFIENFSFTFQDGMVVDYTAEKGRDTLTQMLAADEGAKHLGEVALVPYSSPIRRSGILFYSTLFDENAACHLALGSAYPDTMDGYFSLTPQQQAERGYNDSVIHVDFMFGTADLSVLGTTADGRTLPVFQNGEWAI
ncbi:MAG: aminopeptidase [Angelakisella sp.]